jgi:hypothetical protein
MRADNGAVVVVTGTRELRVEGDPDLARRVLALCDGDRTLDEIVEQLGAGDARADVRELATVLLRHGALRDAR